MLEESTNADVEDVFKALDAKPTEVVVPTKKAGKPKGNGKAKTPITEPVFVLLKADGTYEILAAAIPLEQAAAIMSDTGLSVMKGHYLLPWSE